MDIRGPASCAKNENTRKRDVIVLIEECFVDSQVATVRTKET